MIETEGHRQLSLFEPVLLSRASEERLKVDEIQDGRLVATGHLVGEVAVNPEDLFNQES